MSFLSFLDFSFLDLIYKNKKTMDKHDSHKPYEDKEYKFDIYSMLDIDINDLKEYKELKPFDVKSDKLKFVNFPTDRYIPVNTEKTQIVLHHTVSDPNSAMGDINYWASDKRRIATAIVVELNGDAYQCFSSKCWGYHLGAGNSNLDKHSIGVEIDSWGGLLLGDGITTHDFGFKKVKMEKGSFYNAYGNIVKLKDNEIQEYPKGFRGYKYFSKYSEEQIDSVGELILLWNKTYGIPLDFNEDMFDYSEKAMKGTPGIWSHTSFRKDKNDIHPQPEMIQMLKSLK
jgi:hypothetical protein